MQAFVGTKMEDTKPLFMEKIEFQYRDEALLLALLGISEDQFSNARNKINIFTIEKLFTTKWLSTETLMGDMKFVVMGDK